MRQRFERKAFCAAEELACVGVGVGVGGVVVVVVVVVCVGGSFFFFLRGGPLVRRGEVG